MGIIQSMIGLLVPNHENALVYQVDDIDRLRRFLCFGSENGTYYVLNDAGGQEDLGMQNVECIVRLLQAGRGPEVVREIRSFSEAGRAYRQESSLFALAWCARCGDEATKKLAYDSIDQICRIPTHLFQFVDLCEKMSRPSRGWGRAHRRAIWYVEYNVTRMYAGTHARTCTHALKRSHARERTHTRERT